MNILFVCTGNASRSAASETILRKMLSDIGIFDIEVHSCGISVPNGLYREEIMCRIAREHGYAMGGKAVAISEDLLACADLIIVMTQSHKKEVTKLIKYKTEGLIFLFNDYCFGENIDLPDPHYQTELVYRRCFETIERGCCQIINKLK